jgi:hypothetical protein
MGLKDTIRKILKEDTQQKTIKLIDKIGFVDASKYVGGYNNLKKLLGDYELPKNIKIDTIKTLISNTDEGISLFDFVGGPIPYREDNNGYYHQIEYLGPTKAIINVYGGYDNGIDAGEYGITYESLPNKSLEDIFEIILDEIERND